MASNFHLAIGLNSAEKVILFRFRVEITEIASRVTSSFDIFVSEVNVAKRVTSVAVLTIEIAFGRHSSTINGNFANFVILGHFIVVFYDDEGSKRLV